MRFGSRVWMAALAVTLIPAATVLAQSGQHLDVNSTAFRVTDTSELVAHLKIPQSELSKFSAGHEAEIRVDAMPDEVFVARIDRISSDFEPATSIS